SIPSSASAPTTTAAGSEPKRVRTVTIRPDGIDPSGRPVGGLSPSSGPSTTPARPATSAKSSQSGRNTGPLSLDPQATASAPPSPRDRVATAALPPAAPPAPAQP